MPGPLIIHAIGSLGDVAPPILLGRELRLRGHQVRVIAGERYAPLVADAGLEHRPLGIDFEELVPVPSWQVWSDGKGLAHTMRDGWRRLRPALETMLSETDAACIGAQAILSSTLAAVGYHIGESHRIPYASLQMQPWEPTREFPHSMAFSGGWSGGWSGGLTNRLGYTLVDQVLWQLTRSAVNRWRTTSLGLDPLPWYGPANRARRQQIPVLCAFSPHVVTPPDDWGSHVHVTGYWFAEGPTDWEPTPGLVDFLGAGPPPVYVGFGSWQPEDEARVHALACSALRGAGVRGVLQGRSLETSDPHRYGTDMFVVGRIPHEWLFPQTAAVVHHGGAGTTGAGLRAGVPNVVCPFQVDQLFWGTRVAALGAGPRPLPVTHLRADVLGSAISTAVRDPGMRAAAAMLGERLRAERGIERACDVIEDCVRHPVIPGQADH
ncbi:glycosyltransferase [Rhodococcus daqingensis]|uniref:Glycosyltransferase n=1 Tax=Rhodococcus daqingensis TaxID=2479363 RepID=A0ABW2S485_9NOCA